MIFLIFFNVYFPLFWAILVTIVYEEYYFDPLSISFVILRRQRRKDISH